MFSLDRPNTLTEGQIVYCVLIKREVQFDRFSLAHVWDFGLVLTPLQERGPAAFTRIGAYCEDNGFIAKRGLEGPKPSKENIAFLMRTMRIFQDNNQESEVLIY